MGPKSLVRRFLEAALGLRGFGWSVKSEGRQVPRKLIFKILFVPNGKSNSMISIFENKKSLKAACKILMPIVKFISYLSNESYLFNL